MTQRRLQERRSSLGTTPVPPVCDAKSEPPYDPEILNPGSSICVVTGYTPGDPTWREIGRVTSATMRDYCLRQGYAFRCHTGGFESGLHPSWSKVKWIRDALRNHDTVLWLDADALVTNPYQRIEDLNRGPEELVLCSDPAGVNCGAILIRRSPFAERWLQNLWNERIHHKAGLWEQDATHKLIWQGRAAGHLAIVEPRRFNSEGVGKDGCYFTWRLGDFVCHVYRTFGKDALKLQGVLDVVQRCTKGIDETWIERAKDAARKIPPYPADRYAGRGIVTAAGGQVYQLQAYVLFRLLRRLGCTFPIQCWQGASECNDWWTETCMDLGVECVTAENSGYANIPDVSFKFQDKIKYPPGSGNAYARKIHAVLMSKWKEVLWLDADNFPVKDPSFLLDDPTYRAIGSLLWPDNVQADNAPNLRAFGIAPRIDVCQAGLETGQIVIDKSRCWESLAMTKWYSENSEYWYRHSWGDKDLFLAGWLVTGTPLNVAQPCRGDPMSIQQLGPDGVPLFHHRVGPWGKFSLTGKNESSPWYPHHADCLEFINDYRILHGAQR